MDGAFNPKGNERTERRARVFKLLNNHFYSDRFIDQHDAEIAIEITKLLISIPGLKDNAPVSHEFAGKEMELVFLNSEGEVQRAPHPYKIPHDQEKLLSDLEMLVRARPASEETTDEPILNFFVFFERVKNFRYYGEVAEEFENLSRQAAERLLSTEDHQSRLGVLRERIADLLLEEIQWADSARKVTILNQDISAFRSSTLLSPQYYDRVKTELSARARLVGP